MGNIDVLRQYSADELLYFKDIAFGYPDRIKKWNRPVNVTIIGSSSREDHQEIEKVVAELAGVLGSEKIRFSPVNGNLRIHFPKTTHEFENQEPDRLNWGGYAQPTMSFFNTINQVDIYISPDVKGKHRFSAIRHEFCHAMGLWGHSKRRYTDGRLLGIWAVTLDSYESSTRLPVRLSEADCRVLQLLYEDELPAGLSQSDFTGYLQTIGIPR